MTYAGKKAAVIGLAVNNTPLVRFLVERGAEVTVLDRKTRDELQEYLDRLTGLPVTYHLGPDYLEHLRGHEVIFLSPGVPKNLPALQEAAASGAVFSSELQVFFAENRERNGSPVLGVTGSSGKTTTTTMLGMMLEKEKPVKVGGNIGRPPLSFLPELTPETWVILELSSFQLQDLGYSPQIAVLLNITPNHLDVHSSFAEYVQAKEEIIKSQSGNDIAIFNWDNPVTRRLAATAKGKVYFFSRCAQPETGAFVKNGDIILRLDGKNEEYICPAVERRLPGEHNLENILAAALAARLAGVSPKAIAGVIREFKGVEHRLEFLRELDGVAYYNDSKATTPEETIAGLRALSVPVVLIAGGYDKKLPFTELAKEAAGRCRVVILIGATAGKIRRALEAVEGKNRLLQEIHQAATLEEAVTIARSKAGAGEAVLLSPACASYDMFRNFEERGRRFKELVFSMQP
ncbi:MAG: UDP-N-acetylmuramoyl-L-alanine--D-glutamate ligase [Firmicutes bacterium]|nr:UDP-N-acetylmuramoyl-L-alanine--D-glutamate ligase [Bacillota bacterium]